MIHSSVLWLLFTFQIVYAVHDYKKCNISSWINGCPASTKCSQIAESNSSSYAGECHCIGDNYEFNKNYKTDSDYCLFIDNRVLASKSSSTQSDQDAVIKPVSSHHILGGIFISICVVVIFTLLAIGVRKLRIKQRIRNLRMTQRNRPLYKDEMMMLRTLTHGMDGKLSTSACVIRSAVLRLRGGSDINVNPLEEMRGSPDGGSTSTPPTPPIQPQNSPANLPSPPIPPPQRLNSPASPQSPPPQRANSSANEPSPQSPPPQRTHTPVSPESSDDQLMQEFRRKIQDPENRRKLKDLLRSLGDSDNAGDNTKRRKM